MPSGQRLRFLLILLSTLWAATGCGGATEAVPTAEVRDSAGVRIVTSTAPASEWAVGSEPTLEIGRNDADSTQVLFQVRGAELLSDDGVLVGQGAPPLLRWYDATGRLRVGTGRAGDGPGEFGGEGGYFDLWPSTADSAFTWEHFLRRMHVFGPDGTFVRSVVLDLPPDLPTRSYPQGVGRLGKGFVSFVLPPRDTRAVGEVWRDQSTYHRFEATGSHVDVLDRLPGYTHFTMRWTLPDGNEVTSVGRPPFAKIPVAWSDARGFYYGSNDTPELVRYDASGARTLLIRPVASTREVTQEVIHRYAELRMREAPEDPMQRRRWEEALADSPYAETLPFYRRIRGDDLGHLWAEVYPAPGEDETRWLVFDADGVWVAEVRLPTAWHVLDIGEEHLLVLTRTDFDVEVVARYPLTRPATPRPR